MLTFPKYQPIYFKDIPNCGSCDKITIPRGNLYIQAKADGFLMPELYPVGNFDTNPFNPITSTDLVFDFPNTPNFNTYYTLYIDNNIYVFMFKPIISATPYTYVVYGNLTAISINIAFDNIPTPIAHPSIVGRMALAYADLIDTIHGTTTTFTGSLPYTFTVANIPNGSYLDDKIDNLLSNITTIGARATGNVSVQNIFYDTENKQMCYYLFKEPFSSLGYAFNINLTAGKKYVFNSYFKSVFTDWQNVQLSIVDFTNPSVQHPLSITFNNSVIITPTVTGNHQLSILANQPVLPHTSGLCLDDISLKEVCEITEISIIVDGVENILPVNYYTITLVNNNFIIELLLDEWFTVAFDDNDVDFTTKCFQVKLKDCENNTYTSNVFKSVDPDNLKCGFKQIRLTWYNKCSFAGNEYPTGVMNDVYLNGFVKRISGDRKDRSVFTSSEGKLSLAYNYSVDKYNLKIVNYTENTHNFIERAVLHSHFYINDERFVLDESSSYDYGRSNSDRFTSDINLIKDGSELIVIDCCE
jgi:hypothetical protein